MKKPNRLVNAVDRAARMEQYERQATAMRSFIDVCRSCMTVEQWSHYYPEAEKSAGETFHIVRDLVFALTAIQIPIEPKLREAIESVIEECGVDQNHWSDLKRLNYDAYWQGRYGYNNANDNVSDNSCPYSPSESGG